MNGRKLDFYGRRLKHEEADKQHKRMASLPSEVSHQQMQDTIELELRSHLDNAKNDLTTISNNIQHKIKQELTKYPQFAAEESELTKQVKILQEKFAIFEDEIIRRTKDLLRSYKVMQHESNTVQKRIGETATMKEVEMITNMVRSELHE